MIYSHFFLKIYFSLKCFIILHNILKIKVDWTSVGFPGGTVVKNPPANARDTGSNPGPGRSHMPRSN